MFFEETYALSPNNIVHASMRMALRTVCPTMTDETAVATMRRWAADIRQVFVIDNLNALPVGKILDNASEQDVNKRFIGAHTFGEGLERMCVGIKNVCADVSKLRSDMATIRCEMTAMATMQLEISSKLTEFMSLHRHRSADINNTPSNGVDSSTSTPPLNLVLASEPPKWPHSLKSLANVSFASLVYQYFHDELDRVPFDRKNYAQRDGLQAIKIARAFMGSSVPPPFHTVTDDTSRAQWRRDVQVLSNNVQQRVLDHLNRFKPVGARARPRTGAVSGIVRAWTSLTDEERCIRP